MLVDQKLVSHASSKLVNQFIILGGKRSAVTAEYRKVVVFCNHFIENFETNHSMSLYMSGFKVRKKIMQTHDKNTVTLTKTGGKFLRLGLKCYAKY